jgi:hypothetical protein
VKRNRTAGRDHSLLFALPGFGRCFGCLKTWAKPLARAGVMRVSARRDFSHEANLRHMSGNSADTSKRYFSELIGSSNSLPSAKESRNFHWKITRRQLSRHFCGLATLVGDWASERENFCRFPRSVGAIFSEGDIVSGFLGQRWFREKASCTVQRKSCRFESGYAVPQMGCCIRLVATLDPNWSFRRQSCFPPVGVSGIKQTFCIERADPLRKSATPPRILPSVLASC